MTRLVATAALALALSGCNAGRVFIAGTGDYADYRRVRIAESLDARMAATWHYLKTRPDGRYAERLRRYFDRAEPVYYAARKRNVEGLEAYLRALPKGPHAAEALDQLTALKLERRREALDTRLAEAASRRLDADRRSRRAAAELPLVWARLLLEPRLWQRPLSEAPRELLVRWSLALPHPVCQDDDPEPGLRRCMKSAGVAFRARGKGRRVDRLVALDIELVLGADWRLRRAILSGKNVFVQAREAALDRALDEGDSAVRREAAERFVTALGKRLFADAIACDGGTDESGVTMLDCEGIRITVEPGANGDDLMILERVPAPAEPTESQPPLDQP